MIQESHLAFSKCGLVQPSPHLRNYLMGQCGTCSWLSVQLCCSKVTRVLISRLPVSDECKKKFIYSQWNVPWRQKKLVIFRAKQLPWACEPPEREPALSTDPAQAAVMELLLSVAWHLFMGTANWAWAAARWTAREDTEVQVRGQGHTSNDVWVGLCLHCLFCA